MSHSDPEVHVHAAAQESEAEHEPAGDEGHAHAKPWGDYNARPPGPSSLPPINGPALAVFALALVAMLGAITYYSFVLSAHRPAPQEQHGE